VNDASSDSLGARRAEPNIPWSRSLASGGAAKTLASGKKSLASGGAAKTLASGKAWLFLLDSNVADATSDSLGGWRLESAACSRGASNGLASAAAKTSLSLLDSAVADASSGSLGGRRVESPACLFGATSGLASATAKTSLSLLDSAVNDASSSDSLGARRAACSRSIASVGAAKTPAFSKAWLSLLDSSMADVSSDALRGWRVEFTACSQGASIGLASATGKDSLSLLKLAVSDASSDSLGASSDSLGAYCGTPPSGGAKRGPAFATARTWLSLLDTDVTDSSSDSLGAWKAERCDTCSRKLCFGGESKAPASGPAWLSLLDSPSGGASRGFSSGAANSWLSLLVSAATLASSDSVGAKRSRSPPSCSDGAMTGLATVSSPFEEGLLD